MSRQRRKDIEQQKAREDRKATRKSKKSHLMEEPSLVREPGTEQYKKRILVVSEGENTEPTYFNKFRIANVIVHPVGVGKSTVKLVKEVPSILKNRFKGKKVDEVWVAFDKDNNNDFEQAIRLAQASGYHVAYSNQAIEYWFLLHFNDHQGGPMDRARYASVINAAIKPYAVYDTNSKIVTKEFFDVMMSRNPNTGQTYIQEALDRASKIYSNKEDKLSESVTTVFQLVKSITGMETTQEKRKKAGKR